MFFFKRPCAGFPFSDPERLEKWIRAVSRELDKGTQWRPTQYSRLFSYHFIDDDYVEGTKIKTLKSTAVPTLIPTYPLHKQPAVKTPRAPPKVRLPIKTNTNQDYDLPPIKRIKLDHTYSSSSVEDALNHTKGDLAQSNRKLLKKQKEVKLLERKVKNKDDKLSALIENLKKTACSDQTKLIS